MAFVSPLVTANVEEPAVLEKLRSLEPYVVEFMKTQGDEAGLAASLQTHDEWNSYTHETRRVYVVDYTKPLADGFTATGQILVLINTKGVVRCVLITTNVSGPGFVPSITKWFNKMSKYFFG